jgi:hypothetical protein
VRDILKDSAEDQVGPPGEDQPGWDQYFGWGRINARSAVEMAQPTGFQDDMEAGEETWSHEIVYPDLGYGDQWHWSDERNHTPGGQFSWKCGDDAGGDYSPEISAALISPAISVTSGSVLTFWHWMDVYAPDDEMAGDGGVIEASTNGGSTWFGLTPTDGYTHAWAGISFQPFRPGQGVWSGSFDWRQETVLLGDLNGTIQIRFRFGTRGVPPTGEGWYVDDVKVTLGQTSDVHDIAGLDTGPRLLANWPNPASGSTHLRFRLGHPVPVVLTIHDVRGRLIRRMDMGIRPAGAHEVTLDARDQRGRPLPAGVYLYRIALGKTLRTGRMVLLK